eukprot:1021674-Rhodomonas_salina.1
MKAEDFDAATRTKEEAAARDESSKPHRSLSDGAGSSEIRVGEAAERSEPRTSDPTQVSLDLGADAAAMLQLQCLPSQPQNWPHPSPPLTIPQPDTPNRPPSHSCMPVRRSESASSSAEFASSVELECESRRLQARKVARAGIVEKLLGYNLFDTEGPHGLCEVLWQKLGVECASDLQFLQNQDVDSFQKDGLIKPIQAQKLRRLVHDLSPVVPGP